LYKYFFSFFIKCLIICELLPENTPDNNYAYDQATILSFNQYIIEKMKDKNNKNTINENLVEINKPGKRWSEML